MPQMLIEVSRNVAILADSEALMRGVHEAIGISGDFRLSGTATRMQIFDAFVIGDDGRPASGFVSVTLKVKPGRSDETLQAVTQAIFASIAASLVEVIKMPVQLNVDVQPLHETAMLNEVLIPLAAP